jgi:ribosomal protein S18 acetylase RimI-like enzyme
MMMIRPTTPEDIEALTAIAERTSVFKPHEIVALGEVLDDYFAVNHDEGHRSYTADSDGRVAGFVYFAPVAMTDRTWDLWWIAVDPASQGSGVGKKLILFAEDEMRKAGGRLLTIDTADTREYEPTRRFYLRVGYLLAATLPDYYRDGEGKCIFSKHL